MRFFSSRYRDYTTTVENFAAHRARYFSKGCEEGCQEETRTVRVFFSSAAAQERIPPSAVRRKPPPADGLFWRKFTLYV